MIYDYGFFMKYWIMLSLCTLRQSCASSSDLQSCSKHYTSSLLNYMYSIVLVLLTMKQSVEEIRLVFAVGSAVAVDKCAWGESYWCSDLHAAKECGAFKHCMSTVWMNQKLVQVNQ